jgi:pimeloyl-ACP methyl ester carboxylesterase
MTMRNLSMRTRLIASASALAIAATGFITVAPASASEVCAPGAATCAGELPNGLGKYDVKVPANFNGTVLVYFHGYKMSKNTPLPDSLAALTGYANDPTYSSAGEGAARVWFGNGTAEVAAGNSPAAIAALTAKGYALAGLGYGDTQGWAMQEAVVAGDALIAKIRAGYVQNTKKVIVWGNSLGGTIAQVVAETNKQVDGAVPICGVYAGLPTNLRIATDVMYVLKTIGGIPLTITYGAAPTGNAQAGQDLLMVLGALQAVQANANITTEQFYAGVLKLPPATFQGIAGLPMSRVILLAALIAGLPEASRTYDGITTAGTISVSQISSMVASIENLAGVIILGVQLKLEAEYRARRAGGIGSAGSANFVDNVNTDYVSRLSDGDLAAYEFLFNIGADGKSDNTLFDKILDKLNASKGVAAQRLVGSSAAMAAMDSLLSPTGKVRVPTVSFSPEIDPLVPAGHLLWLKGQARAHDRAALASWKVKVAEAKKAKKKKLPAKPKPRPLVALYADAPDGGWTTFGPTGIDAAATAAKRTSGVGHCSSDSNPTVAFGQTVAAIDAVNTWVTKGEKAGREAVAAALSNESLFFQQDPFWQPPKMKVLP